MKILQKKSPLLKVVILVGQLPLSTISEATALDMPW